MKGSKRDDRLVRIANFILRRTSKRYQDNLNMVIGLGFAKMDEEIAKMEEAVEGQEPLIPADDVDDTAKYVSHPTWRLFGDELLTPAKARDRLSSTDTESTGETS